MAHRTSAILLSTNLLLLAGCAGNPRMTTDRVSFTPLDEEMVKVPCKSSLRACFRKSSAFNTTALADYEKYAKEHFWTTTILQTPSPDVCDIVFVYDYAKLNDSGYPDIYSAYTGEFLARFEGNMMWTANAVCQAFKDESGPLFRKIPGSSVIARRAPAQRPEATEKDSSGLSAADIERLAKALRGGESSAAAPPPASNLPSPIRPNFQSPERPDDVAVIVGVETYSNIATKAPYAERDAEAVKAHIRALGVPERNIALLTGPKAVRSALSKNIEGWLPRMVKPDSRVYFYFSGHGAPDVKTGQAYLVPWDGDPNFLESTAYPVAQLYKKLGELPAKQVLVAMDSCFSGAGGRSVLATGARPLITKVETGAVPSRLTVLAASAPDEISGSLEDKGHGAFTYFFLEGLAGAAKDGGGHVTAKSLLDYLTPHVKDEARRLNRDQTPQLLGADLTLR